MALTGIIYQPLTETSVFTRKSRNMRASNDHKTFLNRSCSLSNSHHAVIIVKNKKNKNEIIIRLNIEMIS